MAKKEILLLTTWVISIIATFGSLFFSEVLGYMPCDLCWYQRILMYPLVLLLGIAIVRKDLNICFYGSLMAGIGGVISVYHYTNQKYIMFPGLTCGYVPCNTEYINIFGFITIPFLAFISFLYIAVVNFLISKQ